MASTGLLVWHFNSAGIQIRLSKPRLSIVGISVRIRSMFFSSYTCLYPPMLPCYWPTCPIPSRIVPMDTSPIQSFSSVFPFLALPFRLKRSYFLNYFLSHFLNSYMRLRFSVGRLFVQCNGKSSVVPSIAPPIRQLCWSWKKWTWTVSTTLMRYRHHFWYWDLSATLRCGRIVVTCCDLPLYSHLSISFFLYLFSIRKSGGSESGNSNGTGKVKRSTFTANCDRSRKTWHGTHSQFIHSEKAKDRKNKRSMWERGCLPLWCFNKEPKVTISLQTTGQRHTPTPTEHTDTHTITTAAS